MPDKEFMISTRRFLQKLYPPAKISQCKKYFTFSIRGVGHGDEALNEQIESKGGKVRKLKTMTDPHYPYLFITF